VEVFIIDPALPAYKVPPGTGSSGGNNKCNPKVNLDLKIVQSIANKMPSYFEIMKA